MKENWKFIYYQGSCIKEVDENKRRLLFQIPGTSQVTRVWISMNLSTFENSAGNGFYRKIFYKDSFTFSGYQLVDGYKIDYTISAPVLAEYCKHMHAHIQETIQMRKDSELLKRKRYNDQRGRY